MSLPRFLERVVDATAPILSGLDRAAVREKLKTTSVTLIAGERALDEPARGGFLFAASLAARLYPSIRLAGPKALVHDAEGEIILVNPRADVASLDDATTTATLAYEATTEDEHAVAVAARGWNVHVDVSAGGEEPPAAAAALLAAALGASELFRIVFADGLAERGRCERNPTGFNLITLGDPVSGLPLAAGLEVGEFRLVGAGAIGQAAARTLAQAGVRGTLMAVDDDKVALSNLQRYVLARDSDVGAVKVDLLHERLASSGITVVPVPARWHAALVEDQLPTLVALDSAEARIGVQASLPGPIYNAWTQPADAGWSRHERFGDKPCLACLYWPAHQAPSRHEQIAAAFGQHPLRVLAYLVHSGVPVGQPLPQGGIPVIPGLDAPPEAERWLTTPLVDDLAAAAGIGVEELASWRDRSLADVYQHGICGGALLHLNVGEAPTEVLVPLAHQSAFAGVMLATGFLVAQVPELAALRPSAVEARFDVLAGLRQVMPRPRVRTAGCLCGDAVFQDVYGDKLGAAGDRSGCVGTITPT